MEPATRIQTREGPKGGSGMMEKFKVLRWIGRSTIQLFIQGEKSKLLIAETAGKIEYPPKQVKLCIFSI
jgi:hypothetical protein